MKGLGDIPCRRHAICWRRIKTMSARFTGNPTSAAFPEIGTHNDPTRAQQDRMDWLQRLVWLARHQTLDAAQKKAATAFTRYLVEEQRFDLAPNMIDGFWLLTEDPVMDGDARNEFAVQPTFIAVAWLARMQLEHAPLTQEVEGFRHALRTGLRLLARGRLRGKGYDSDRQMLNHIAILALGRVFDLPHPLIKQFSHLRSEADTYIREEMPHASDWSKTRSEFREAALEFLWGQRDPRDDLHFLELFLAEILPPPPVRRE